MAYTELADNRGRQVKTWVANESEDGSGTWHIPLVDSSGQLKVSLASILDNLLFKIGTDDDIVILNRSTSLDANTALANVLIGTPVSQAIAANSFMLSNVTASGDIGLYVNKGGHSQMVFWADGSAGDVALLSSSLIGFYIAGTRIAYLQSGLLSINEANIRLALSDDPNSGPNFAERTTALNADTAISNLLEGTVVGQALAAKSLIISNTQNDGDIALYTSKAGNTQMGLFLDGSTGDSAILAASGASVDHYIAGTKVLDHAAGAFAFQENTTISSTGTLTVDAGAGTLAIITTGNAGLKITTTSGSASGVLIDIVQDSATPAAGDYLLNINATGDDSEGTGGLFTQISCRSMVVTAGSEDGEFDFALIAAGTWAGKVYKMLPTGMFVTPNGITVGATQVLGAQGAAVADVSDGLLATTITQLNAFLARARAHGIIAT